MTSFLTRTVETVRQRGPLEIFTLVTAAKPSGPLTRDDLWMLVQKILKAAKRGEHGLRIVEYPNYHLKAPVPKSLPQRKYIRAALEALQESKYPLSLNALTAHYLQRFPHAVLVPEFWMFRALQTDGKKLIAQGGKLRVGLKKEVTQREISVRSRKDSMTESSGVDPLHTRMYEENLESLLAERLEELEPGLSLVQRQYVTPVGRIDLLCRDRKRNLVIVELKRFRASTESIIDQITRYMGWVQQHLAKPFETVRACIVVGKVDQKLEYSIRAIPNLSVKCFRVSLSDPD